MNTIGRNYENALAQVNDPGATGPNGTNGYFIPSADGSMDCATLKTNFDRLDNQIQYWYGILQTGDNSSAERENLNKIINTQKTKKDYYSTLMLRNCSTATTTVAPPDDQLTDDDINPSQEPLPTTSGSNNSNLIWVAAAGIGLYLATKKKGKGKKVKGMSRDNTALLLSGGTYLLMYFRERRSSTPQNPEPIAPGEPIPINPTTVESYPTTVDYSYPTTIVESGPIPEPMDFTGPISLPPGSFVGEGEQEMAIIPDQPLYF